MRKEVLDVTKQIDLLKDDMVKALIEMCSIPAISPKSGGDGEYKKAKWLEEHLKSLGFTNFERYDSPDKSVSTGSRPNIVVRTKGREKLKTIWIVTHTDVVPPGDLTKWETDPFRPDLKDDKVYGRGVEDNGQALIASLYALKAINDMGLTPKYNAGLAFVADEEVGSTHGIKYIIDKKLFGKNDLIVVPDMGSKNGMAIEIAEKTILWLKITTIGRQVHAASPEKGINAHRISIEFAYILDRLLHKRYTKKNKLFTPGYSTFEPTRKDANVPNINTVPGEDVFYFDCRVMPGYDVDNLMSLIKREAKKIEKRTGAEIRIDIMNREDAAPITSITCEAYKKLAGAIKEVRSKKAKPIGIGGGTCAAIFRKRGYPTVCWGTSDGNPHTPHEFTRVENLIADAKVYAALFL